MMNVHNLPSARSRQPDNKSVALLAIIMVQVLVLWSLAWWFAVTWLIGEII
jgi:hypothetical protein